jgi:hypothetical protein
MISKWNKLIHSLVTRAQAEKQYNQYTRSSIRELFEENKPNTPNFIG